MVAEGPRQTRLKNVTELQGKHFTTHTFVIFTAVVIRGGVAYLTSRLFTHSNRNAGFWKTKRLVIISDGKYFTSRYQNRTTVLGKYIKKTIL